MKHAAYIYDELKRVAPFLAKISKINVYSVPENYFSGLDKAVLKKVFSGEFPLLPASEAIFTVPGGYFENLPGNILQRIKYPGFSDAGEELNQVSPLLFSIQQQNVYTVPPGYFETLPLSVINTLKPLAKVVALKKKSIVWNCAAAAIITGVMATIALWTGNTSIKQPGFTARDIHVPLNIKNAVEYNSQQELNKGITELSEADIIKYLETTGSNADDEGIASGIPDKELPDELDYLRDENTLQIFLQKASAGSSQN